MRITQSGNMFYASWRDAKTHELRFVLENTRVRAISVGLFCAMGLSTQDV